MGRSTRLPVDDLHLIRPALVHAVAVARAGQVAEPPEQPPDGLRRVLRFHKLQTAALDTVRRVLDSDEAFRQRVIEAVNEDELGRLAWVWLTRPDGWVEEVARLAAEARKAGEEDLDERDTPRLRRALAGAEEAARRHEAAAQQAHEAARRAQAELAEARAARRDAERAASDARVEAEQSGEARDVALQRTQAAVTELDRLGAELDIARTALHEAESELVIERSSKRSDDDLQVRLTKAGGNDQAEPAWSRSGADAGPPIDVRALASQLRAARASTTALSNALAEMAGALSAGCAEAGEDRLTHGGPPSQSPSPQSRERAPAGGRSSSRRPAPMPPGVWDDTPEAAGHLVRLPGAVVLVDGYNVARTAWPALTPTEERSRLVAALEELHARTGAEVTVVFDGVREGAPLPGHGSRTVRVRFTAEGVSADDVVRDLVDEFPPQRPVIVVSSDREVADGARSRGANAVSSRQFLSAIGR